MPSSSRGLGANGATIGHPGLYEVELNSLNTGSSNERHHNASFANERNHQGPHGSWRHRRVDRQQVAAQWRRNNRFHPEVISLGHWTAVLNSFTKQLRRDVEALQTCIVDNARLSDQHSPRHIAMQWGSLVHQVNHLKREIFNAPSPGDVEHAMPLQLRDTGAARAHETVRIRSRRPRRRCNNNRHCVYAVEDNQDGPPSSNEQATHAEHNLNVDTLDNATHDDPTTDENRLSADTNIHTEAQAGTRAVEQTAVNNTPDPTLQRRLDRLARTPRQPLQPGAAIQDRIELQGRQITHALATLLERARTAERNTDHIIEAIRTANRNVETVQDRARKDRTSISNLREQLNNLTHLVETTRSELRDLIDYVGAGPERMQHDFSLDMSSIPNADTTTIPPTTLHTLIEQINTTTDQTFSRLNVWNNNVFNPVNAFGLNAILTIFRTLTEYMIAHLNAKAYGGLTLD
jgi:hypothetical protein